LGNNDCSASQARILPLNVLLEVPDAVVAGMIIDNDELVVGVVLLLY
jgi:hypothetical protein